MIAAFTWNDTTVSQLRDLIASGATASEAERWFADRYTGGPSRNAILGKAHRLKISFGQGQGRAARPTAPASPPMRRRVSFNWIPEANRLLRALADDGASASQIAARLAEEFPQSFPPTAKSVFEKARALGVRLKSAAPPAPAPEPAPEPLRETPTPDARPERVTLLELRAGMCRWPLGDPQDEGFRYCGGHTELERPYCAAHRAVAYVPSTKNKRRTPAQEAADERRRHMAVQRIMAGKSARTGLYGRR
jgi:GcrA cell cycle regulator